jgi:hypothetical protein
MQHDSTGIAPKAIRQAIWERVRNRIGGFPIIRWIFGGGAFREIPYSKNAELHDPKSWKSHQLAVSLLAFERDQEYQTIEKKIVPTKRRRRSRI